MWRTALLNALLLIILPTVASAQTIEVSAGSSSLLAGTGVGTVLYFPTQTFALAGGVEYGHTTIGFSDSFQFHGYQTTIGDKLFGFGFDGAGLSVVNRGIAISRSSESEQITAFVGETGFAYFAPFFQGATPRHFGAGFFLQKRIGRLQWTSLDVLDGSKKTLAEGFSYRRKIFRLAGNGGLLNSSRYLNGLADFEPTHYLHFAAMHQNYFWPQRSTFNNVSAFTSFWHLTAQASVMTGISRGQKITGESFGAGAHFAGFVEHSDFYKSGRQRFINHTVWENFRRLSFSETLTQSAGRNNLSFGGGYHGNSFSLDLGQSVLFFLNGRGFQQVTTAQLSFRVPHTDAAVNLAGLLNAGKLKYTSYGTDYFYSDRFALGSQQTRSIGKYLLTGRVLDTQNNPIEGAVIRIGKAMVISDSAGVFTFRTNKAKLLPLQVLTEEFLLGSWQIVSAPATAQAATDPEPVLIVVRHRAL